MFGKIFSVCVALCLCVGTSVFAEDAALTIPSLGIDWADTVTALGTTVGTILMAALGLWAAIKLVVAAKAFIGSSIRGR